MPETLTIKDVAKLLKLSYSTVYNNRSNWGFFKVAEVRGWRIYKTDLDKIRQKQIWCLANRLYHAVRAAYSIV
nr:helix-turn-helix domain-containing protein [uncultured Haemophilus sp.]